MATAAASASQRRDSAEEAVSEIRMGTGLNLGTCRGCSR
jgi:hypothetical protein